MTAALKRGQLDLRPPNKRRQKGWRPSKAELLEAERIALVRQHAIEELRAERDRWREYARRLERRLGVSR